MGFFEGMFVGMLFPLIVLGGEIKSSKEAKDIFYAGIILGILADIAIGVGLYLLLRR